MFALFLFSEDGDGYPVPSLVRVGTNRDQLVSDHFGDHLISEIRGFNGWYDSPIYVNDADPRRRDGIKFMVVPMIPVLGGWVMPDHYFFQI